MVYKFHVFFFSGHGRGKRSHTFKEFDPCTSKGVAALKRCMSKQKKNTEEKFAMECKYDTHSCFYVVRCYPAGHGYYECKQIDHYRSYKGICCDPKPGECPETH